jgi:hypothetical protein
MNSLQAALRTESRTKTPHEMLLINGFAKVANDPIVQSTGSTMSGSGHRLATDLLRWPRFANLQVARSVLLLSWLG